MILFDVAMVFAVALMVAFAIQSRMTEFLTAEDATFVKNAGKPDMEIIVNPPPTQLPPVNWGASLLGLVISAVVLNVALTFWQLYIRGQEELNKKLFLFANIWLVVSHFTILGILYLPLEDRVRGTLILMYFPISLVAAVVIYHRTF